MSTPYRATLVPAAPDGALQRVLNAQALFEDAVAKNRRLDADGQAFVERTREEFHRLAQNAATREQAEEELSHEEHQEVLGLARRRAYVLPEEELALEAESLLSEMRDWGVPPSVLEELTKRATKVSGPNPVLARAALNKLLEDYDYWDWYSDWYVKQVSLTALSLGLGAIATLFLSLALSLNGHHLFAVPVAATSGAAISILGKLPPMTVYGNAASIYMRVSARLSSGILASCVGLWLFTSGIINITLGDTSLKDIATACINTQTPAQGTTCRSTDFLLLLTLAVLLGFSERALSSYEKLLPTGEGAASADDPKKPATGDTAKT
jgi:hypothetical protein